MQTEQIILSVDTTNKNISAAISKGEKILSYVERLNCQDHSQMIVSIVETTLKNASLNYTNIHYLVITNGPGGFTSLRVGIAFAKAIKLFSNNIKLGAVSNFDVHAFRASQQITKFNKNIVILNGTRGSFFIEIFAPKEKIFSGSIYENHLEEFIKSLINKNPKDIIIISGNAVQKSWNLLKNISSLIFLPRFHFIRAVYICKLSQYKISHSEKFQSLEPIYSKPPLD